MLAGRGVDAHNPQASHVTFAFPSMAVGVAKGVQQGFLGLLNKATPPSPMALGHLKQSLVAVIYGHTTLNSWQGDNSQ